MLYSFNATFAAASTLLSNSVSDLGISIFSSFGFSTSLGFSAFLAITGASFGDAISGGLEIGGAGTGTVDTGCEMGVAGDDLCSDGIFELLVGSYLKGFSGSKMIKL